MSRMSELDMDRQASYEKFRLSGCPQRPQARAVYLQRTCGTYATARYLRNRGYTLEQALDLLDLRRHQS